MPQAMGPEAFDDLVAALDYPMVIVTAAAEGERAGCFVGFTTQVSIHPRRYLVCISRRNHTHRVASRAPVLAVHFPTPAERPLANLFGEQTGDEIDKFARCAWTPGVDGVPLLDEVGSRFVGRVTERIELGDHTGFVLEVLDAATQDGFEPLMFQSVQDMRPGHEP